MVTFADCSLAQLGLLRDDLQALAGRCETLRQGAEVCLGRLQEEFSETLVLARCYATLPVSFLPEPEKEFARRVASERNLDEVMSDQADVVVLAAAGGRKPEWSDPARSGHPLAVPLLTPDCLEPIPLVGRVLSATVSELPWLQRQETLMVTETTGKMSHLILVEDARTTATSNGAKAVPEQDFVVANGVRSVMAMGGRYLNGVSLVLVLYTGESLTQEQAAKFPTLVNAIKTATMKAVMATRFF